MHIPSDNAANNNIRGPLLYSFFNKHEGKGNCSEKAESHKFNIETAELPLNHNNISKNPSYQDYSNKSATSEPCVPTHHWSLSHLIPEVDSVSIVYGKKTIGQWSSFVYLVNQTFGAGILALPLVVKSSGWFLSFVVNALVCFMSTCGTLMILRCMTMVKDNSNFERRMEYIPTVEYFLGTTARIWTEIYFYISIQSLNILSIAAVSNSMDYLIFKVFGSSASLTIIPFELSLSFQKLNTKQLIDYIYKTKVHYIAPISLGYIITGIICIILSMQTMSENIYVQYVSFAFLLLSITEISWSAVRRILTKSQVRFPNFFGCYRFSELFSTFIASYSYNNVIPTWGNEVKEDVNISKAVYTGSIFCATVYYTFGILLATAYPRVSSDNVLEELLAIQSTDNLTRINIYAFNLLTLLPGILVYSITTRCNLLNSNLTSPRKSFIYSSVFPFLIGWLFLNQRYTSAILLWSSLLFGLVVNFIIPSIVYLVATSSQRFAIRNPIRCKQAINEYQLLVSERVDEIIRLLAKQFYTYLNTHTKHKCFSTTQASSEKDINFQYSNKNLCSNKSNSDYSFTKQNRSLNRLSPDNTKHDLLMPLLDTQTAFSTSEPRNNKTDLKSAFAELSAAKLFHECVCTIDNNEQNGTKVFPPDAESKRRSEFTRPTLKSVLLNTDANSQCPLCETLELCDNHQQDSKKSETLCPFISLLSQENELRDDAYMLDWSSGSSNQHTSRSQSDDIRNCSNVIPWRHSNVECICPCASWDPQDINSGLSQPDMSSYMIVSSSSDDEAAQSPSSKQNGSMRSKSNSNMENRTSGLFHSFKTYPQKGTPVSKHSSIYAKQWLQAAYSISAPGYNCSERLTPSGCHTQVDYQLASTFIKPGNYPKLVCPLWVFKSWLDAVCSRSAESTTPSTISFETLAKDRTHNYLVSYIKALTTDPCIYSQLHKSNAKHPFDILYPERFTSVRYVNSMRTPCHMQKNNSEFKKWNLYQNNSLPTSFFQQSTPNSRLEHGSFPGHNDFLTKKIFTSSQYAKNCLTQLPSKEQHLQKSAAWSVELEFLPVELESIYSPRSILLMPTKAHSVPMFFSQKRRSLNSMFHRNSLGNIREVCSKKKKKKYSRNTEYNDDSSADKLVHSNMDECTNDFSREATRNTLNNNYMHSSSSHISSMMSFKRASSCLFQQPSQRKFSEDIHESEKFLKYFQNRSSYSFAQSYPTHYLNTVPSFQIHFVNRSKASLALPPVIMETIPIHNLFEYMHSAEKDAEDAYECDEKGNTELKPIRIHVYPRGMLRIYHHQVTKLLLVLLVSFCILSVGSELIIQLLKKLGYAISMPPNCKISEILT